MPLLVFREGLLLVPELDYVEIGEDIQFRTGSAAGIARGTVVQLIWTGSGLRRVYRTHTQMVTSSWPMLGLHSALISESRADSLFVSAPGINQQEMENLREQLDLARLDPDYTIVTNFPVQYHRGVQLEAQPIASSLPVAPEELNRSAELFGLAFYGKDVPEEKPGPSWYDKLLEDD